MESEIKNKSDTFEFDAFISYSTEPDYRLVRKTESFLERIDQLKTPEEVELKKLEICVDGSDFKRPHISDADPSKHLPETLKEIITEYLRKSKYLIVFCSPQTKKSTWVENEILLFLEKRSLDDIFLVVTAGDDPGNRPEEVFHDILIEQKVLEKQTYYDFRGYYSKDSAFSFLRTKKYSSQPKVRDYEQERIRLAADLQPDKTITAEVLKPLWFEEQQKRNKLILRIAFVIIILLSGLTGFALVQRSFALKNLKKSQANLFTTEARRLLQEDPARALEFSIKSLSVYATPMASDVLVSSLRRMPAYNEIEVVPGRREQTVTIWDEHRLSDVFFLQNERYIFTRDDSTATIWDIETGNPVPSVLPEARVEATAVSADGSLLALRSTEGTIFLIETTPYALPRRKVEQVEGKYEDGLWMSEDGSLLASVGTSGKLELIDLASGHKTILPLEKPKALTIDRNNTRIFILTEQGGLGMYDIQVNRWQDLASSTGFSRFSDDIEDDFKRLSAFILKAEDGGVSQEKPLDANGLLVDQLNLTGYMTKIIAEEISDEFEEEVSAVNYKAQYPCDLAYIDKVDALVANCHFRSIFYQEVWDMQAQRQVDSYEGLFSEVSINRDEAQFILAGPKAFAQYQLVRQAQDSLEVKQLDAWETTLRSKRIGVPRRVVHSPKGKYLASTFAPFMLLQGAPASTVILWANDRADARDGNDHFAFQLRPHVKFTENVIFSPSSKRLATYSAEGMLRVWQIIHEDQFLNTRNYINELDLSEVYDEQNSIVLQPVYYPEMFFNFLAAEFNDPAEYIHAAEKISLVDLNEERLSELTATVDWEFADPNEAKVSPGYDFLKNTYDPIIWNEELPPLIQAIHEETFSDEKVLKQYHKIIRQNVLLLSGLQNDWAEEILKRANHPDRLAAIYVIGLSGNASRIPVLEQFAQASEDTEEQKAFSWAIRFLQQHGKELSLTGVLQTSTPEKLTPHHFLAFPVKSPQALERHLGQLAQLLGHPSDKLKEVALKKSVVGVGPGSPLAPMAFYYVVAGKETPKFLSILAEIAMYQKRYEEALALAFASKKLNPNDPDIYNNIGNIYTEMDKHQEAIRWYQQSIDKGRKDGWPLINMARRYQDLGELELAERYYREALQYETQARAPFEYAEYLNGFAWFIVQHHNEDESKLKEALKASQKSIYILNQNRDPKGELPHFLDTLAAIYFAMGDKQRARYFQTLARDMLSVESSTWLEFNETLEKYQ